MSIVYRTILMCCRNYHGIHPLVIYVSKKCQTLEFWLSQQTPKLPWNLTSANMWQTEIPFVVICGFCYPVLTSTSLTLLPSVSNDCFSLTLFFSRLPYWTVVTTTCYRLLSWLLHSLTLTKLTKLRGLSPRANYTDRAAAAGRRS